MKTKLFNLWHSFSSNYWFVPTLMTTIAIALSFCTTAFDTVLPSDVTEKIGWLHSGGPEGARSILSTVAGSMITTAGVVSSITIVVLSLTSSQFAQRKFPSAFSYDDIGNLRLVSVPVSFAEIVEAAR